MLEGVLIAESLRVGAELSGIPLQVIKIARIEVANAAPEQPRQWTRMDFAADERDAECLADQLAACLAPNGGWYVNYNTASEAFVVFPENVFRYPRGDADGREKAKVHARSIDIPEAQLDWQD